MPNIATTNAVATNIDKKNILFIAFLYSLTPPCNISFIKYFLPKRNTPIIGIVQITEHASKSPHNVTSLKLPLKIANPTGKVLIDSVFVTINGHIKLFQLVTNVNIARVETTGIASGSAILKNVEKILQPSILADSSKSLGNPKKYCLIINIPNPPNNAGKIKA